jgi:hypothetical protein
VLLAAARETGGRWICIERGGGVKKYNDGPWTPPKHTLFADLSVQEFRISAFPAKADISAEASMNADPVDAVALSAYALHMASLKPIV